MSQQHLTQLAQVSPLILSAIENNREAFTALMSKIKEESQGKLFKTGMEAPDGERGDHLPKHPELDDLDAVLMGHFLVAFLAQQLTIVEEFGPAMDYLYDQGLDIGEAYNVVRHMRAN